MNRRGIESTGLTQALRERFGDGEEHALSDAVAALAHLVPPEIASRFWQKRGGRGRRWPPPADEYAQALCTGQRSVILQHIKAIGGLGEQRRGRSVLTFRLPNTRDIEPSASTQTATRKRSTMTTERGVQDADTRATMDAMVTLEPMSEDEARTCVEEIKADLQNIRTRLFELREREGWKALGYETWQACIQTEFTMSRSRAYQLLNAHMVDRILAPPPTDPAMSTIVDIETPIPEAHARVLVSLVTEPQILREVYVEVQKLTEGKPTAADYREVIDRRLGRESTYDELSSEVDVASPADRQSLFRRLAQDPAVIQEAAEIGSPVRAAMASLENRAALVRGRRHEQMIQADPIARRLDRGQASADLMSICARAARDNERWAEEIRDLRRRCGHQGEDHLLLIRDSVDRLRVVLELLEGLAASGQTDLDGFLETIFERGADE